MKKNEKFLKLIAKVSLNSAKKACGAVSWFDCYQPKEPVNIAERFKECKKS